jgi:hypothetical protein
MALSFRKAMLNKLAKRSTLKYGLSRSGKMWVATIIGPFHHRFYGTTAMAMSDTRAVERLKETLLSDGWLGGITFSDVDEQDSDKVQVRKRPNADIRAADVIGQVCG